MIKLRRKNPDQKELIHRQKDIIQKNEINSTMDAYQTCQLLLSLIKKSNFNNLLEETAFSVTIKMKKAFIKNKD